MSEKINHIVAIKTELNEVVSRRQETQKKIIGYQSKIEELRNLSNIQGENPEMVKVQIDQIEKIVYALHIKNAGEVYDMDKHTTSAQDELFFQWTQILHNNPVVHTKEEDDLIPVKIEFLTLDYIRYKHPAVKFETGNHKIIIVYPVITLVQDDNNAYYIVPSCDLNITFFQNNTATESTQTAKKYTQPAQVSIETVYDVTFYFQDENFSQLFEERFNAFYKLSQSLFTNEVKGIKRAYYDMMTEFGTRFSAFLSELSVHDSLIKAIQTETKINSSKDSVIENLAMFDLLKTFNQIAELLDMSSNESFSILYLHNLFSANNIGSYEDIIKLNEPVAKKYYDELVQAIEEELTSEKEKEEITFYLARFLFQYDKELATEYLTHLYRYASIVIKADGRVSRREENALRKILVQSDFERVQQNVTELVKEQSLDEILYELYDLTGLFTVKQEINTLINLIKLQKARQQFDLKNTDMSQHIVFSGNPGTGKTSVARILSKIYKCLGVLKKGHLIETDRSGMIAEYVGQTAIKVNKLVDAALDGVLFIDEAYALLLDDKDTYGREAIATLLKRMEDDRERLIVVLAGYTGEMDSFIHSNPGLKSRFNKYIHFPDYTPDELYSIFIGMCKKLHFKLENKLVDKLKLRFLEEIEKGDPSFGNGRYVRNMFEKMIENQANRLAHEGELDRDKLVLLKEIDLPI